jgi:arylsulfatase A-like enzyme
MRSLLQIACVAVCALGLALAACSGDGTLVRYPRVVLVTFDTLHVGHTGLFDPEIDDTPEIDRLAASGLLFEQARTTVPMTLPSHSSMLSGRTPVGMGLLRNGQKLGPSVETLTQRLAAAGYHTGAFLSLATLRQEFGLDRGFEVYNDGHRTVPRFYRTADEVFAAAAAWVEQRGEEPYFLWVHYSDAHEPYVQVGAPADVVIDLDGVEQGRFNLTSREVHRVTVSLAPGRHDLRWTSQRPPRADDLAETSLRLHLLPSVDLGTWAAPGQGLPRGEVGLETPFTISLENDGTEAVEFDLSFDGGMRKPPPSEVLENYAAEVRYADGYFGRLRRLVESAGPTLWIVASDHGEGLYRHGDVVGHAGFGFEDQLRILWLLHGPGVPEGRRIAAPALVHDIAPTVLDLLGLPPLEAAEGISFVPCWRQGDCPAERRWFAHGFHRVLGKVSALAVYRWPLKTLRQRAPGSGSYDLEVDPWERRDLSHTRDRKVRLELRRLGRDLQDVTTLLERMLADGETDLSDEDLEMLRSLGYLGN